MGGANRGLLVGGVEELARALSEEVKADPERYYRLALRFDASISMRYLLAVCSALAGSSESAPFAIDLVSQFRRRIHRNTGLASAGP